MNITPQSTVGPDSAVRNNTVIQALCVFLVIAVVAQSPAAYAQTPEVENQDRELRGIDLVVLVDVSRSMSAGDAGGSDPERIRWDAVKLMLDLLGPGDRVMIQRFNEHCPAGFSSNEDPEKYKQYLIGLGFLNSEMTFDEKLLPLTPENRSRIARKIESFNREDDDDPQNDTPSYKGLLDQGYTAIVDALVKVSKEISNSSTVRSPHVVLLTDGLDSHVKGGEPYKGGPDLKKRYRELAELRETLAFFDRTDELGNGEVPIHIIGLNLDTENEEHAKLARLLLTRVAFLSGGQFFEVSDTKKLIEGYIKLLREIKGYWENEIRYDPVTGKTYAVNTEIRYDAKTGNALEVKTAGELTEPKSLVVNGIRDLGILSFATRSSANVKNQKFSIQPLQRPVEFQWDSPASVGIRAPEPRTGKDSTLYRYTYFGPETGQGKSPFAFPEFADPGVTLNLVMRSDELQQRLILLKGTEVNLFSLGSPEAGARFRRNQTLTIQVDMARASGFAPGQFSAVATVTPVGTGGLIDAADSAGGKTAWESLKLVPFVNDDGGRGFTGQLHLLKLPRGDHDSDSYQVAVRVEGRGVPEIEKHGLSGSGRNLTPRLFSVENSLFLHPLMDIDLSNAAQSGEIEVATVKPVKEDIELNVSIRRPASRNGELTADSLPITFSNGDAAEGRLVLKRGRATIKVVLEKNGKIERSIEYTPGSIRLSDPAGLLKPNTNERSLESSIRLALDLGRARLLPSQQLLVASEAEAISRPMKVELSPAKQPGFEDQTVMVTLQLPKDSKSAGDPKRTFGADELWLARVGDQPVASGKRTQTLAGIKLDEEFRIHLHTREDKTPGKYPFKLNVTGDWLVPVEADVDVSVMSPEIELDATSQTLHLAPGQSGQTVFRGWLTSALKGSQQPVHVADAFVGRQVEFSLETDGVATSKFEVDCPHIEHPVVLRPVLSGEESAQQLPFNIRVPAHTPYGRYVAEFTLSGPDVLPKTLTIRVVVNSLEIDIASSDASTGKGIWRPARENDVVQLNEVPMMQWLRVRTGLGEPFKNEDQISVLRVGPFKDDDGDIQRLPILEKKLLEDRRGILLKIEFPAVSNFNGQGDPYTIGIVTTATELHVPEKRFEFRVRYLRARDIIRSSTAQP